jgi:lysozyme
MRHITDEGLGLIKQFEGFSPKIYLCPAEYPTIGFGHVVLPEEQSRFDGGIIREEAAELLRRDVRIAASAVSRLITNPMADGQFDALVSFTFNLGAGALQRSSLRKKVNRGEHGDVPVELMKWVWSAGRKLPGLMRRRQAEGALYSAAMLAGRSRIGADEG